MTVSSLQELRDALNHVSAPPRSAPIRFGSVCSGIEAASVAWEPLGWEAAWVSEIEAFPSAVLAHHWPDVPNLGDMLALPERMERGEIEAPDVFVGGCPCQSFSLAGRRESLSDARGNLTLAYVELADAIDRKRAEQRRDPCVTVFENVPGILNTHDNAFGCFLGALAGEDVPLDPPGGKWSNAGAVFGPKRAVAWRILDAQYFGVAQRRRRVFVVASARAWFDPCEVLFEREGVRRDSAPSRETQQDAAADAGSSAPRAGSHWDKLSNPHPSLNQSHNTGGIGASNQEVFSQRGSGLVQEKRGPVVATITTQAARMVAFGEYSEDGSASTVKARDYKDATDLVYGVVAILEAGARTGKSTTDKRAGMGVGEDGDPMYTLQAGKQHAVAVTGDISHTLNTANNGKGSSEGGTGRGTPIIAFSAKDYGGDARENLSPTLRAGGHSGSHANAGVMPAVAHTVALRGRAGGATAELGGEVATALRASSGGGDKPHVLAVHGTQDPCVGVGVEVAFAQGRNNGGENAILQTLAVRRLIPKECERLQGFPDDHTLVAYRNKPAADGPRYKANGNSMAVPVMHWIGRRIQDHLDG